MSQIIEEIAKIYDRIKADKLRIQHVPDGWELHLHPSDFYALVNALNGDAKKRLLVEHRIGFYDVDIDDTLERGRPAFRPPKA